MSERSVGGLAYELAGSGPAILFSHAGITDRRMWEPQWRSWQQRFTLIRYDLRGFGGSEDPTGPYSLHGDALAVLDAAGIERAVLIGASMAGEAVLDLTLAAPDRVSALVLVNATAGGWQHTDEHMAEFAKVIAAYESGGIEAACEADLRMWVDGVGRSAADVDAGFRELVARMDLGVLEREDAREQAGTEIEPDALDPPAINRLGDLDLPLLVVTGAHDQPSQLAGALAIAAATGAEASEIPGTAHLPSLERPQEFEGVVLPFVERHAR